MMEMTMGEMVSIPIEEYQALREAADDLTDLHAYDRAMAALKSGDDEMVPADVAKRLIAGESPLRVWREHRSLTQAALAVSANVNRVQIADIEAGRSTGSVQTLRKLADGLHVTIDELV